MHSLRFAASLVFSSALFAQANPASPAQTSPSAPPATNVTQPVAATPNPKVAAPSAVRQTAETYPEATITAGTALFQQKCAFCHGRDAGGGESGPDLTRSALVGADQHGDKIGDVVRNGRLEKGMPKFSVSDTDLTALAAFIHSQKAKADARPGRRRGVDPEDLQTGNAASGKAFFMGAGGCSGCHSVAGDLQHIARRYQGLKLEQQMLYPRNPKAAEVTVSPASGETIAGTLAYLDEFTVALRDANGQYRSWPVHAVQYQVHAPVEAHADLLARYTDEDIHNLMAYLQTLK